MNKICTKCKKLLNYNSFYKRRGTTDGLRHWCKKCISESNKKWYNNNKERRLDQISRYYKENKDSINTTKKTYKEKNKVVIVEKNKKYRKLNQYKDNAHKKVRRAIKAGKLQKQNCKICGNTKTEAHHPNYSKPLFVWWLCKSCHLKLHGSQNAIEGSI